jgi:Tol biopolymer transport system component
MLRSPFATKRAWRRLVAALALTFSVLVWSSPGSNAGTVTNGRIAFQRVFWNAQGHTLRIALFTIDPDGTDVQQLTDPPAGMATKRPDWSPDGAFIAYMRGIVPEKEQRVRYRIFRIRTDGTDREDLTKGHCRRRSCFGEEDPAWSPDGERIAFVRVAGDVASLFVMRADGTHRRRVMPAPSKRFIDSAPAWSPDGQRLVFVRSDRRRAAAALFVVRLDDARTRRITLWTLDGGNYPDWSPDGNAIVFQEPIAHGSTQLFVIHPNGTGLRSITGTPRFGWSWAGFSPDGTMITAVRSDGETTENDVYVMNSDGTGIQPVTGSLPAPGEPLPPAEGLPDWGAAT